MKFARKLLSRVKTSFKPTPVSSVLLAIPQKSHLLRLPPELVLAIIEHLPLVDTLSFACTSKVSYELATPSINRFLIVTPQKLDQLRQRYTSGRHCVHLVQSAIIEQLEEVTPWDIQETFEFLNLFPRIQRLETRGGAHFVHWDALDALGTLIGTRLVELQGKLVIRDRTSLCPPPAPSQLLQILDLEVIPQQDPRLCTILPNIHARFPSITELTIRIHASIFDLPYDRSNLFLFQDDNPHFPHLRAFHLIFGAERFESLDRDAMSFLQNFLRKHSSTLEELTLPAVHMWGDFEEYDIQSDPFCLRLRYLSASLEFACFLVERRRIAVDTLREVRFTRVSLSSFAAICLPFTTSLSHTTVVPGRSHDVPSLCYFGEAPIRSLTLRYHSGEIRDVFDLLPGVFPDMEELHLDYDQHDSQRLTLSQLNTTYSPFLRAARNLRYITTKGFHGRTSQTFYRVARCPNNSDIKIELVKIKPLRGPEYWDQCNWW